MICKKYSIKIMGLNHIADFEVSLKTHIAI